MSRRALAGSGISGTLVAVCVWTAVPRFGLWRFPWVAPVSFQSRALGVGHDESREALASLRVSREPVVQVAARCRRGPCSLSLSLTQVISPSPDLALAPLRLLFPQTVTVGQSSGDPDSLSLVSRSNVRSGQHVPESIIPERGQVPENNSKSPGNKHGGVFHEDEAGSYFAKYSCELAPQAASFAARDALSLARSRNVLAREAAADRQLLAMLAHPSEGIGAFGGALGEGANVVPDSHSGEAEGEDSAGVGLDLDGEDGARADENVGEQPSAGAGEEVAGVNGTIHGMAKLKE